MPVSSSKHNHSTVAVLTGGQDKPYALGLAASLSSAGIPFDFIGSDEVTSAELRKDPLVNFLNLRGDQRRDVKLWRKALRLLAYYRRLISYAVTAKPRIFHILWNEKLVVFERTVLALFFRLLGRRIVLTAHNINAGKRDVRDSLINRFSLRFQYRLSHHIFVHTKAMKAELVAEFAVPSEKITVIPFGLNNTLPRTQLTTLQARQKLGLARHHKALLFFGNIAPYKGLEFLVDAFAKVARSNPDYRLIIAGPVKNCAAYWGEIKQTIQSNGLQDRVLQRSEFIPDEEAELYFKAADVLLLPYIHIFQSGVLFLSYSFGLPVIATDVGSLKEDVLVGKTGLICHPGDVPSLAKAITSYFSSDLFKELPTRREFICDYANQRYSWTKVADMTKTVYSHLLGSGNETNSGAEPALLSSTARKCAE